MTAAGLVIVWASNASAHGVAGEESTFVTVVNDIFTSESSPLFLILVFFFSFLLGAAHALTPGHGKTVVSAYMVGTGGTVKDAVTLGISVTVMHLSSVVALGIFLALTSRYVIPPGIKSTMGALSGLIIVCIGLHMTYRRWQDKIHRDHPHGHGTDPHHHSHGESSGKKTALSI